MKMNNLTKEELSTMSYDEIAYMVLEKAGKKMKLIDLYKEMNELLGNDPTDLDHITDFFDILSTNKKFVMLEGNYWDLQTKHKSQVVIEDVEDEDEEETVENEEETSNEQSIDEDGEVTEKNNDEDIFYEGDETDDTNENDLADLVIIDEDEELGM